ncbi:unnamed protein product, partial [Laminaria digitata]
LFTFFNLNADIIDTYTKIKETPAVRWKIRRNLCKLRVIRRSRVVRYDLMKYTGIYLRGLAFYLIHLLILRRMIPGMTYHTSIHAFLFTFFNLNADIIDTYTKIKETPAVRW